MEELHVLHGCRELGGPQGGALRLAAASGPACMQQGQAVIPMGCLSASKLGAWLKANQGHGHELYCAAAAR